MTEPSFIDEFSSIVNQQREAIREETEEEDTLVAVEKAHIDALYGDELEKREAIADRAKTLNMAWLASQVLIEKGVREQEWLRQVPKTEPRGIFKKRDVVVGSRSTIALEGWQFYDFKALKPGRYDHRFSFAQRATILVLLKDGGMSAVTDWDTYQQPGLDWEMRDVVGDGPRVITPLGRDPLEDGMLPYVWTKLEQPYNENGDEKYLGGIHWTGIEGDMATYTAGSHEAHNKYGIEDRIRKALGSLVARHTK
jgi:hypothetical protein